MNAVIRMLVFPIPPIPQLEHVINIIGLGDKEFRGQLSPEHAFFLGDWDTYKKVTGLESWLSSKESIHCFYKGPEFSS